MHAGVSPILLVDAVLFLLALLGMEAVAWVMHRYVMHGWLWALHRSHHEPRAGWFELNDLFAVIFALPSVLLIWTGMRFWAPALWIGLGIMGYGLVYAIFHDGLVHRRFPLPFPSRWLKRQVQAHRMHHAVSTKHGAVSFGFLWAPSVRRLKAQAHGLPLRPASSTVPRETRP